MKNFKSALEQAKQLYPGQPQVADILNNLGMTLQQAEKYDESLQYLKEAKEILDNHIDEGYLTLEVLHNIGASYQYLGMFLLAFQFYKDALDTVDKTMISGKHYNTLCKGMTETMMKLNPTSRRKAAVMVKEKTPLTDDTCHTVNSFYGLILLSASYELDDEDLETLESIRKLPELLNYKSGRVVLILLLLSMICGWMGSFDKSRIYYKEAKEMAKSLPPEDDSILPGELGMIEWMKKE